MNKIQGGIVNELKEKAKMLGHSPKRREVESLARKCYRYFDSFNEAKKKAGLSIVNVRITLFPKNSFKIDKELARIAAHLTGDGHIYKDLKGLQFYSKNREVLKELEKIIYKKFELRGKYGEGNGYGKCFRYTVFNSKLTKFLNELSIPAGDKMVTPFDVPDWIKNNKELSKEYLKILFYCEGSKYKQSKNTEKIKINFNKTEELLEDGLKFMNSLKELLSDLNIETTNIWVSKGNKRKRDGKITKRINFHIRSNSNNTFINEIGWIK
jgi:hypothetical protein